MTAHDPGVSGSARDLDITGDRAVVHGTPWAVALNSTAASDDVSVTLLALAVADDVIQVSGVVLVIGRPNADGGPSASPAMQVAGWPGIRVAADVGSPVTCAVCGCALHAAPVRGRDPKACRIECLTAGHRTDGTGPGLCHTVPDGPAGFKSLKI